MEAEKNFFHKLGDWWKNSGVELIEALLTILMTVVGVLLGIYPSIWWLWIVFVLLSIFSIVFNFKALRKSKKIISLEKKLKDKSDKIQTLEGTIEKIEGVNYKLFQYLLISLYNKLNLDSTHRISIYKKKKDRFIILSRYSINPEFEKINRSFYPITEGFISHALRSGEYFVDDLPEYKENGRHHYYTTIQKLCSIDIETLRAMTMKSRSYYCKALTDAAGIERKAVIVFESINPQDLDKDQITEVMKLEEQKLVAFIENVRLRLPDVDTVLAQNYGF